LSASYQKAHTTTANTTYAIKIFTSGVFKGDQKSANFLPKAKPLDNFMLDFTRSQTEAE